MDISVKQQKLFAKLHSHNVSVNGSKILWVPLDMRSPYSADNFDKKFLERLIKRNLVDKTELDDFSIYSLNKAGKTFYHENVERKAA